MAVERLNGILKEHGPASIAVIGSNRTTNEENYLLGRFARTVLGTNNLDHHRTADFPSLVGALTAAKADGPLRDHRGYCRGVQHSRWSATTPPTSIR